MYNIYTVLVGNPYMMMMRTDTD